jgi:hypothetical protein
MPSSRPDQRGDSTFGNKIQLFEFDAGSNAKLWDIVVSGGVLTIRTRTDADAAGVDVLTITRTASTAIASLVMLPAMIQAFADDAAAAVGLIPVGGLYRTASALKIRVA